MSMASLNISARLMNRALICAFAALVTACATPRVVQDYQRDSVALIVRDSVIFRDSVIMVEVPEGQDKAVLPDTDTSRLRTSVAESEAWVRDGRLHHTLKNRADAMLPVSIRLPERLHYQEKGLTRYMRTVERVEVEKELSKWQSFVMTLGYAVMIVALAWLAWKLSKIVRI